jgi:hypothetical protein
MKLSSQNVTNYTFSATTGTYTQLQGTGGSTSPALINIRFQAHHIIG